MTETLALVALVLVAAVAFIAIRARRQPDTFDYGRSIVVRAPAERIFPLIADLAAMNTWNPFNEDPSITGTYTEATRGPGARYSFASRKAGTGHIDVMAESPPREVAMRLVMTKPFACDNRVEFRLEPVSDGTRVTWRMAGPSNFMSKVMGQFIDCEGMCGTQFEKGLTKLKSIVERGPHQQEAA